MSDRPGPSSALTDLTPGAPHNREAEEAVLGAVLVNPEAYYDVASFLATDDFFLHRNRWVWEAFNRLHDQRQPMDILTVSEELERQGHLEEAGGPAYLAGLISNVASSLHAEAYGRLVEEAATRRRLLAAANQIAKLAYQNETIVEEVVNESEKAVFGVSERRHAHQLQPIRNVLSDYYDRIDYLARHRDETIGVPTGFIDLDRLLGGMQPSDLLIIAGRPGQGKSGFCLSAAKNASQLHKKHVAVFSLEMSNDQVVQRLIAQETGIDSQRLRLGDIHDEEWPLFTQAVSALGDTHIFLDDTPALTPLQLRTKCRRLHMEVHLDLVIVDYVQLMTGDSRIDNRVQEVSYITRNLKVLARELNLPVLAAAQLSRAVEQRSDKRPVLSDLRESGCLAGDTLVTLADSGEVVPIRELNGKAGTPIWALNSETMRLESAPISRAFSTGTKPVFKMRTGLGRSIRATANHRFLTLQGWKRLDELSPGDCIALPRSLASAPSHTMSTAELALLGHLLGDGCTLPRHAIQYTTRERDLAETVASLSQELFGEDVAPRIAQERSWYQVYLTSTRHHTHHVHSAIADWLTDLSVFGCRSHEKHVPARVFRQPAEGIATFLRHLWATDGSIQLVKGKKVRPLAYYASSSRRLAQDVQALLLRLEINAILRCTPQNGKGRDQYNVVIAGRPDLLRFAERVGAVGVYQQRRLDQVKAYLEERTGNTNRDIIPRTAWRLYVVPAMRRAGMTTRQMQAAMGHEYCGTGLYKQNLSRERASRVANIVASAELSALATSDVYWDSIAAIEPDGVDEVFDLTVPGLHNFVANNMIVHNSLEQDADVVLFIYRPDQYETDTLKQNLAEIIVAKHRNGPVGSVELVFRSSLAKFENAETRRIQLGEEAPA